MGFHGRTSNFLNQQTRNGKRLITDHLCRQAKPGPSRQQAVLGISFKQLRRRFRGLSVGGTHDDNLQDPLDVPPGLDKLSRQPIQQLLMGRTITLRPEVVDSLDQAGAK